MQTEDLATQAPEESWREGSQVIVDLYADIPGTEDARQKNGMSHNSVPLTDSKISNTSKMVHGLQQTRNNRRIPISAARLCFLPMPRLCRLPGQDGAGCTAACYYTAQN